MSQADRRQPTVEAAGGVVLDATSGAPMVLVVHRPKWDDWTLPKGHVEPGETLDDCALREVREETGLTCDLGSESTETHYVDHRGRTKRVTYWLMRSVSGTFVPNREVDEIAWHSLASAREVLTYDADRQVLDRLAGPQISSAVHLPFRQRPPD